MTKGQKRQLAEKDAVIAAAKDQIAAVLAAKDAELARALAELAALKNNG
ncbi:MAG: hypothetical protein LBT94_05855 [Prevotellaceae bacterium]|jgi:hypothetical protein|nr:hypothetical protein [Prevotellaceae bacterium]